MRSCFIYMYSHAIRMSLVCARMYSYVIRMYSYVLVCHSYVLICHPYVTRVYSYVLVCHLYVARMYSYIIRMSLVCTRTSSVCPSYVLVYHLYVTLLWFYHEPSSIMKNNSHKHMLNKRGPKSDPWGTPNKISSHELYAEFILILCLRFVQIVLNQS